MTRSYAAMTTLITQKLQSSGTADFSVAEVDSMIEEGLKEFSFYSPHVIPVVFKIESRYGTCSSTSADNLIDTTKGQFKSTDDDDEKVIHNTTDNTWAVVLSFSSTAQIGISNDIFASSENYRIYNKRCWNQKQIYLGDMAEWNDIDSVEYPKGSKRNWRILDNNQVMEIDVDSVADSNASSAITTQPNVDVIVRFRMPHILSQLTDWSGKAAATAAAAATSLAMTSLQSAGTIEVGEEFYIENHKSLYVVTAETTIASNTATVSIYPPLESNVSSTAWVVSFVKSSLTPKQEDVFADLVAARLAISKAAKFTNQIAVGGDTFNKFQTWGERRLGQVLAKLRSEQKPKVKHRYSTE